MKQPIEGLIRDISALGGMPLYTLVSFVFLFFNIPSFFILFFGFLILFLITVLIRGFYFKDRPKKEKITNIFERFDGSSFPSLHTARASLLFFTLASIINNYLLSIVFILIIIFVASSRVLLKKHDLIDVMGGFILGIAVFACMFFLF